MQIFYEKNNVQTRTIFTGNILVVQQPIMKNAIHLQVWSHKSSSRMRMML